MGWNEYFAHPMSYYSELFERLIKNVCVCVFVCVLDVYRGKGELIFSVHTSLRTAVCCVAFL